MMAKRVGKVSRQAKISVLWLATVVLARVSTKASAHEQLGLLKAVSPSPKRLAKVMVAQVRNEVSTG